jgi:DNA-binding Lrp family transcriptional regulator
MLGKTEDEVTRAVKELENKNIVLGYPALIDWEKTGEDVVMAYIEVKVTPQRGQGFDKVAERIYQYPQVKSCSLMSGGYDLLLPWKGNP